jgi:hypothetical protein
MAIGIASVLREIDESSLNGSFSIKYVRKDGTIGFIKRAQKGLGKSIGKCKDGSNFKYSVKDNFLIHIGNVDTNQFRSIKTRGLLEFNGQRIKY